jgi:hypothetical protein
MFHLFAPIALYVREPQMEIVRGEPCTKFIRRMTAQCEHRQIMRLKIAYRLKNVSKRRNRIMIFDVALIYGVNFFIARSHAARSVVTDKHAGPSVDEVIKFRGYAAEFDDRKATIYERLISRIAQDAVDIKASSLIGKNIYCT